ncbi:bcl-2-like protein 15 isoform X1 [Pantherophis guttatus]|uniref:Bcl-2-like protein 15 isoform X1 n=1 Tax=Pantherophis guttatus TaxID=94885 RepID=A0A6P9BR12_PANGU|nr:bcl-2-like protein 15 isoform X1 [Pantherophis guttatus]
MNNSMTFEEQTEQIVEALFTTLCLREPWGQVADRCLELHSGNEVRAQAGDSASNFDPVGIAKLLQSTGDQYNAEIEGQVQAVIVEETRKEIKKFREAVESLSRNWSSQTPGLEPERAFLIVAVKLFVKFINKTDGDNGLINILTETINGNPEVRGYIERQGGWSHLDRSLNNP